MTGSPALGDDVMRQGRALGDPTRFAIFRYLDESVTPVGVAELTTHFGLNHTAFRQHLAKLKVAGLVVEEVGVADRPGRPPLRYRPSVDVALRWGGTSPYEDLALLLLEVLAGRPAREVGAEAGRRLAGRARRGVDAVGLLEAITRRQGFEPVRETGADVVELVLGRCPLAEAASVSPELVCELHRGLAEGVAEACGAAVTGLVVRPPRRAGCRLQLTTDGG
jgi:predicted ArsR family transcriptional regulator